jgi:effector-binding domain-containing protein
MRTYDVTLVDLPAQRAAVVRAHLRTDEIEPFIGPAFEEVMSVVGPSGQGVAGMPFARYHVTGDGEFDLEAGFPVHDPVPTRGRVENVTLPAGKAVRILHRGAYGDVGAAYDAGWRWIAEHGYQPAGDPWECYLDGPDVAEPRTEVLMPCAEGSPPSP